MKNENIIYELKNIKDKLRDFAYVINRIIKELEQEQPPTTPSPNHSPQTKADETNKVNRVRSSSEIIKESAQNKDLPSKTRDTTGDNIHTQMKKELDDDYPDEFAKHIGLKYKDKDGWYSNDALDGISVKEKKDGK